MVNMGTIFLILLVVAIFVGIVYFVVFRFIKKDFGNKKIKEVSTCPNCGMTLQEGKKFCTNCGMEVTEK